MVEAGALFCLLQGRLFHSFGGVLSFLRICRFPLGLQLFRTSDTRNFRVILVGRGFCANPSTKVH